MSETVYQRVLRLAAEDEQRSVQTRQRIRSRATWRAVGAPLTP